MVLTGATLARTPQTPGTSSPVTTAQPPKIDVKGVNFYYGTHRVLQNISLAIQPKHPGGWEANSFVADPKFSAFGPSVAAKNDYRLQPNSPATGKGVVLPKDLFDPQRPANDARPDIGAISLGGEVPGFGRQGRVKSPVTGKDSP